MLNKMGEINAEKVMKEFEEATKNAAEIQKETLRKILELNSEAEYLKRTGLNGRSDPNSFKECVPIITYKDIHPFIHRILDGDSTPILTTKPITNISLSSGTSQGKPKFVPFNDELFEKAMQVSRTSYVFREREFPLNNTKGLSFIYSSKQFKTKGGLLAGTATTHVFRHPKFETRTKAMNFQGVSPKEVVFGSEYHQSLYCHLLCGLLHYDQVGFVYSSFAFSIVQAFQTFEHVWQDLCSDIRQGVLNERITDQSIRESMSRLLKPNPELADLIYRKCTGLSKWYGLIPALFPNVKYVHGIMTGSMEPYLRKLRHYASWVPLVCHDYGASEGVIAANVNPRSPPESATFAVVPNIGYFEFIPMNGGLEPKPVGITEVKIGQEYEILVTNFAGLYRYRLGDIVKVMGFHNATPELKFICRKNLMLTVNIDKNTERDLQLAVEEASRSLLSNKVELVDFTSHVDVSKDPGHYVIYWELNGEADETVLKDCTNSLDRAFLDPGYVSARKVGAIGPLELRILKKGTFNKILIHCLNMGGAVSQFKTPRCVGSDNPVFDILSSNVVRSYVSSAY